MVQRPSTLKSSPATPAGERAAFYPDGHRLASAGDDGSGAAVGPRPANMSVGPSHGHTGPVNRVAFSPTAPPGFGGRRRHGAAVGRRHRQPSVSPLTGHTGAVTGVAFSPYGHLLAPAGADTTVRCGTPHRPPVSPLTGPHRLGVRGGVQPRRAPAGLGQRRWHGALWDTDTGNRRRAADRRHRPVPVWRSAPTGAVAARADGTVRLWDADTGQPIGSR